ncbi:hypothetical protein EDB19DRAFT_20894 [Suillus lakei]|nr:hypothetical protein EDB19DRAFT_20894 [Suillus lakei]
MLLQRVLHQARITLPRHVSPLLPVSRLIPLIIYAPKFVLFITVGRRHWISGEISVHHVEFSSILYFLERPIRHLEMPQQIHWTSFGIPYVVEFNNVSFAPRRTASPSQDTLTSFHSPKGSTSVLEQSLPYSCPSATSSTSSFCHISQCMLESPLQTRSSISRLVSLSRAAPSMRSASSFFKRKPHTSTRKPCSSSQKASSNPIDTWCFIPPHAPKPLPPVPQQEHEGIHVDGLHIQFATPPCDPRASSRSRLVRLQKTITSAVVEAGMDTPSALEEQMDDSTNAPDYHSRDTLFRGTYGQVMVALKAAGLVATPCMEGDFAGATRLGALFVAHRSSEERSVQLRKLTLWG